jgi:hypothetical protein
MAILLYKFSNFGQAFICLISANIFSTTPHYQYILFGKTFDIQFIQTKSSY